jgi:tetratricopeptide (TPR) repeat protein
VSLFCAAAAAEPSAQDVALAESLFREAKRLAKDSDYQAACPKFAESQRLDPQIGTLLHLAACHEKEGRTASAWAEYNEAASLAAQAGQSDREEIARERAAALESKLSRLVIEVEEPADGLEVKLDGKVIGDASFATPFPIDPGEHRVEASAPGRGRWSERVTIAEGPHLEKLTIVALPREGDRREEKTPQGTDEGSSGDAQFIAGFVVGGAGIVLVGIGSAFGLLAASQRDEGDEYCDDDNFCERKGLELHDDAYASATASTALFIVGLAATTAGIVLVVTAPRDDGESETSFYLGPHLAGAGAGVSAGVRW